MTAQLQVQLQDALGPDYRIEQELDGGGMSRLFLTTDLRHNRRVVVKVLSPELVSQQSTARFKREIELTVRLQHPHILPILTSGSWDDVLYYITPFIPGESLRERIARDRKLPLDDILKILRDASGALAFAHQRGIVHRDVKPGNILLAEGHAILADFGIARAVSATATGLTGTGMAPGTPAYMAPELPTDDKADVYALGVVACEMLVGALPKRGATATEIIAARGKVAGDSPAALRALATVVASALSPSAELRPASAQLFADAIARAPSAGMRSRPVTIAVTAAVVAAVIAAALTIYGRGPSLDPARYAVLALDGRDSIAAETVQRLGDAVGEWRGVTLADPNVVASSVRGVGKPTVELSDARKIARKLGARNLVSVSAKRDGDTILVKAALYDAANDSSPKVRQTAYGRAADAATRTMELRRLVNGLVRDGDDLPWRAAADRSTPSIAAWRAYDAGRAAIRRWDLAAAEKSFRDAIAGEQDLRFAHLWVAQTLLWSERDQSAAEARAAARRALEQGASLGTRDSLHAAALLAMTESQMAAACTNFRAMIARDSANLAGWIGAGDCQGRDRQVVRDSRTKTGWVFRGSFEGAARAYQRASEIGPSTIETPFRGWVLGRLSRVLYAVTNRVRTGRVIDPDTVQFVALPYLDHDSIAFAPYPASRLSAGLDDPPPAAVQAAAARNRDLLRRAAEEWVRHSPANAVAFDSLAAWTEVAGGFSLVGERQLSTLDIVRRAIALVKDSTERFQLGVSEVRLLVKDGKFGEARVAAESLLAAGLAQHIGAVAGVAGISALLGHVDQTEALLAKDPSNRARRLPNGRELSLPLQLAEAASRTTTLFTLGIRGENSRASARQTADLIHSYYPDTVVAAQLRGLLVVQPLTFGYPEAADLLRSSPDVADAPTNAYLALARGDTGTARSRLDALRRLGAGKVSGVSVDGNFRRAVLALALGDTAAALDELDPVLRALPTLSPKLFTEVAQTTSLVRAFALRAELASRASDRQTMTQTARAVAELWRNADAPLRRTVERMKALSQ